MTTTHTAEQIAREAAEQLFPVAWVIDHEYFPPAVPYDANRLRRESAMPIILTAARKIAALETARLVRESGVDDLLQDIHLSAHCTALAGPLNTPTLQDAWGKFDQLAAKATTALAKFRAIGQPDGEGKA